ncbi:hypothetical protein VM98_34730, partial [Streptomyces rubellomurinus subsp. indigoferus]
GRPSVIVFTAVQGSEDARYLGWGRPRELLESLLASDHRYRTAYLQMESLAAAVHLSLAGDPAVAPAPAPLAAIVVTVPPRRNWIIDRQSDDPSPVLEEELLSDALRPLEAPPREIDSVRLQ